MDPKFNQQSIRSQRDVSIGSNQAVNQAVDQAFNISETLSGYKHQPTSKLLDNKTNFKFQLKSLKHGSRAQQTALKVLRKAKEAATILPSAQARTSYSFPLGASIAVKTSITIAANAYPFKLNSNAANNIQASTPIWRGNTSRGLHRGCDQSKNTFNYHSAEHTMIYGSGLSKIGGCSAYGGGTPCPKMPC